jgi:hypothetical protein
MAAFHVPNSGHCSTTCSIGARKNACDQRPLRGTSCLHCIVATMADLKSARAIACV